MTAEIIDKDMVRAMELLRAEKKEKESQKRCENEKMEELDRVYEALNIPKDEAIRIITFCPANTIIHQINLDLVYSERIAMDINNESYYRLDGGRGGNLEDIDKYYDQRHLTGRDEEVSVYGESQKTNTFYLNTVHVCPFCSKSSVHDYLLDNNDFLNSWRFGGSSETPTNMATEPAKYKRCYDCEDISRKEYLKAKSDERDYRGNKRRSLSLYDLIYPEPIKLSKKYYAEKRVKKVSRVRPLSKGETTFFTMMLGVSKMATLTN